MAGEGRTTLKVAMRPAQMPPHTTASTLLLTKGRQVAALHCPAPAARVAGLQVGAGPARLMLLLLLLLVMGCQGCCSC